MEKQKEYNLRYLLAKVRTTWEKASDRLRQRANATKTVSGVFRHRSRTGKSYCRKRYDVGSERVKIRTSNYFVSNISNILQAFAFYSVAVRYLYLALHLLFYFYSSYLVYFVLFLSCALKCFSVIGIPATCWISPQKVIQRLLKVQELYTAGTEYRRNRLTDTVNSVSRSLCFYLTCGE
jgi:hypothetical protein